MGLGSFEILWVIMSFVYLGGIALVFFFFYKLMKYTGEIAENTRLIARALKDRERPI